MVSGWYSEDMTDIAERIAQLEEDARQLDQQAALLRAAADLLRGSGPSTRNEHIPRKSGGKRRNPNGTMDIALGVLKEEDRPLTPDEMVSRMLERGWVTDSQNPANTLRTALRRMRERNEVLSDGNTYFVPRITDEPDAPVESNDEGF